MAEKASWHPSASRAALEMRAALLRRVREFFARRGVLEVDTPSVSRAGAPDLHLNSLATRINGQLRFLHTSPEYPMKRLLAAGYGDIYQICKVFRDGESGRRHNPEFTLLEWYREGYDHHRLMDEVGQLVTLLLAASHTLMPPQYFTYEQAFVLYAGLDPHRASDADIQARAQRAGLSARETDRDSALDYLAGEVVYPRLGKDRLTFVYDFPASQAALARIVPGEPPLAERFEVFLDGMELANGFHELLDAVEQRRRFEQDNARRQQRGLPEMPLDENFLAALKAGMPDCAGVALGFDRLVMLAAGVDNIGQVIVFPHDQA